ncbi:hypothetical protein D3C85_384870 [compost metagenome]
MARKAKKSAFDYKQKVHIQTPFGVQTTSMYELAGFAVDHAGSLDSVFDMIVCMEKLSEDWGLIDNIALYSMGEVVSLLSNEYGEDEKEWKDSTIKQLEKWLKQLKEA